MGCGPSRARRYQYEIPGEVYSQGFNPNSTPLQPMGGPGPRGPCRRRFGPGCHGPPGPFGRRGGCHRRPPWAQQQYMNAPPNNMSPNGAYQDAPRPISAFAEEAPVPEGFKEGAALLEKEKGGPKRWSGKAEKEKYRDHEKSRESAPPRYSTLS